MTPKRQERLRQQIRRSRARLMVRDPAVAMVLMYLRFRWCVTSICTSPALRSLAVLFVAWCLRSYTRRMVGLVGNILVSQV
jgi:hypothetical protein